MRIEVVTVLLNGLVQDPARVLPFVMKEKCIIEPKGTENVKVSHTNMEVILPVVTDIIFNTKLT